MNGFVLMATSYRAAAENGSMSREEAEKKARLYDFLGTCNQDDFNTLFDSTAFNDIAKGYMRLAVRRLIDNGTIDEEQGRVIRNEYARLFEDMDASKIMEL